MHRKLKMQLSEINPHLICTLCDGYFVEATTIIECLHSFCKSCIVNHLNANKFCPECKTPVHWMRPFLNIRSDKTLQSIVNKLVPDLSENEIKRRMEFSIEKGIPFETGPDVNEGKVVGKHQGVDHYVSLSIEMDKRPLSVTPNQKWIRKEIFLGKRYFRCVDAVSVTTINKMLRLKFQQNDPIEVITFCRGEVLPESYSLMDVVRIFGWKSDCQLMLTYMVFVPPDGKIDLDGPGKDVIESKSMDESAKANRELVPLVNSTDVGQGGFKEIPLETSANEKVMSTASVDVSQSKKYNLHTGRNVSFYSVLNVPLHKVQSTNDQKIEMVEEKRDETLDNKTVGQQLARIANSPEKSKNIDFIANRLQLKQKMQDVSTAKEVLERVPQKSTEAVRKLNSLSNVEAHNLALECMRNKMHLIKSTGSFIDARTMKDMKLQSPMRYRAQTVRRNPLQQFRPLKSKVQIRPKFSPMDPMKYGAGSSGGYAKSEDLQLLSTTRQLATLRQQQKILNEIAAAVSAKGSVTKGSDRKYARAMTSTVGVRPVVDIAVNPPGYIRRQDPLPFPHQVNHVKLSTTYTSPQNVVNVQPTVQPTFQYVQSSSAASATHGLKQNLIYRNTLEKAKACVRDTKVQPRITGVSSRAPMAPYHVPIKSWKETSVNNQSSQRPVSSMPVSNILHTVNSPVLNVAPLKPRIEDPLSLPYYETSSSPMPPAVTQSAQDQPLCLVVKK